MSERTPEDVLREALEQIANAYDVNDECKFCRADIDEEHYTDCASLIARAALDKAIAEAPDTLSDSELRSEAARFGVALPPAPARWYGE